MAVSDALRQARARIAELEQQLQAERQTHKQLRREVDRRVNQGFPELRKEDEAAAGDTPEQRAGL